MHDQTNEVYICKHYQVLESQRPIKHGIQVCVHQLEIGIAKRKLYDSKKGEMGFVT